MILVDYSSIVHRMISAASNDVKAVNGEKPTKDFIFFAMYLIISEIYNTQKTYQNIYGEIILCLDNSNKGYWRKDIYSSYKNKRKKSRDESELNWKEIYLYIEKLNEMIINHLPWKVVQFDRAEADDVILVLSRSKNAFEKILIYSPDKDMIQAQRDTNNVQQYSALTKKWILPENKHDNMEQWLNEHVCLGDSSDEVPKVVDHTEFSENFINHLKENNIDEKFHLVYHFKYGKDDDILHPDIKTKLISTFKKYKTNKKGEETELDIYQDIRFGPSSIEEILNGKWELNQRKEKLTKEKDNLRSQGLKFTHINKEIKSLEIIEETSEKRFNDWLFSHPLYKEHYDRNFTLVMEEGIPTDIWNGIIMEYQNAKTDFNPTEYDKFLKENNLEKLKLITTFEIKNRPLTAEDFDW